GRRRRGAEGEIGPLFVDRQRRGTVRNLHVFGSDHPVIADPLAPLIERAIEIEALSAAIDRLGGGDGGVVVIEASAGLGKTTLVEHAARYAADSGCLVRHAAPGPLERHFPFGVVRALLEGPVRDASESERARLLDGAAATAGELLLDGTVPGNDATPMVAHSLLWLCSAIAEDQPLVLAIDDAHWADRCSLRVLTHMVRRIADTPVLILVAPPAPDPPAPTHLR